MDTIIENEMKAETNLDSQALLGISNFSAGYDASLILKNVDMVVPRNQVVALLGRNGVGKTTLLNSILGLVPSSGGSMTFDGRAVDSMAPDQRARLGIGYVPQGRDIFPGLSVWENLNVSLRVSGAIKDEAEGRLSEVYELFPVLKDMLKRKGGVLSGGQQQQLAIARALIFNPEVIILDEPSEGIQPSIVSFIADTLKKLSRDFNTAFLVVEQNISFISRLNSDCILVHKGSNIKKLTASQLSSVEKARDLLSLEAL